MRRHLALSVFVSVAAVAVLSGCEAKVERDDAAAPVAAASAPSGSPTPTPSVPVVQTIPPVIDAPVSVSNAATKALGAAGVAKVYAAITKFAGVNAINPDVVNIPHGKATGADLAGPKSMMTTGAAASWDSNMADLDGEQAYANLSGVMPYSLNGNGNSLRTDVVQPAVTIKNGAVGVAPNGQIHVSFDIQQDMRVILANGKYQRYNLNRSMEYWMTPGTSAKKPWLIDGWQASYNSTQPVADVR